MNVHGMSEITPSENIVINKHSSGSTLGKVFQDQTYGSNNLKIRNLSINKFPLTNTFKIDNNDSILQGKIVNPIGISLTQEEREEVRFKTQHLLNQLRNDFHQTPEKILENVIFKFINKNGETTTTKFTDLKNNSNLHTQFQKNNQIHIGFKLSTGKTHFLNPNDNTHKLLLPFLKQ